THADGAVETYRCAYLVGCDGAHSAVRHGLGLAFEGAPYEQAFVLADARIEWPLPRDGLVLTLGSPGVVAAFPFSDGTHRLIVTAPGHGENADVPLTVVEVERLVRQVSGVDIRVSDPVWLSRFRLHHRIAERYGVGCAFLVGDAAHIHSPAGGQGMNTGIQDAANLAWKLALVLQGQAGSSLLESYNVERRPIGEVLLKRTDRLFEAAATASRWVVAARNFVIPRLAPLMFRYRALRQRLFRFVSQLGIHYRTSPVVINAGDGSGPRAGDRAPDATLRRDGVDLNLFHAMRGVEHRLLVFGGGPIPVELSQRLPFPCRTIEIERGAGTFDDPHGEAHARYGVGASGAIFLVRPDGYIGVRASSATLVSALHRYAEVLGAAR
ncbi:MAG TPA: FAD-dependent monooxygenase, partial [Burkholderiales bacterium]|nr:FAD-dependent monooxygenase [Burkholderiales bacterium]